MPMVSKDYYNYGMNIFNHEYYQNYIPQQMKDVIKKKKRKKKKIN